MFLNTLRHFIPILQTTLVTKCIINNIYTDYYIYQRNIAVIFEETHFGPLHKFQLFKLSDKI